MNYALIYLLITLTFLQVCQLDNVFFFETQTVVSIQNLTLTGCLHESRNGRKTRRDDFFKCLNGDFYKGGRVIFVRPFSEHRIAQVFL